MSVPHLSSFSSFIRKRHRWIIVAWILALALSITLVPSFFSHVSYDITNVNFGSKNAESQIAQNKINAEFPSSNSSGTNSIILVVNMSDGSVYSDAIRNSLFTLNQTVSSDPSEVNYTGMTSIYSTEYDLLNSTLPSFIPGVNSLASNIAMISSSLYSLRQNLSSLNSNIFQLKQGINQTAQLVYGVPSMFVQAWGALVQQNVTYAQADVMANESIANNLAAEGAQGAEALGYYTIFYSMWNSSWSSYPLLSPTDREASAVNGTVMQFVQNPQLDNTTKGLIMNVAAGLNVTNWYQDSAITNLTLSTISAQIPSSLSSSLGVTPDSLVSSLYDLGPNASSSKLGNLTIGLITNSFSQNSSSSSFSTSQLVNSTYDLGPSPNSSAVWTLASRFFSNATQSSLAKSPLFTINATSLTKLLSGLTNTTSQSQIEAAAQNVISQESYANYPLVLSSSLTKNFVSSDNKTMIVLFNYNFSPDANTITSFQNSVKNSNISTLSTTYVTGSSVILQDVENVFSPALVTTVVAGVLVSIVIVGLLFFAPLAAIIPLVMGGISIAIAYAAIYIGVVLVGKSQITFLTPTLTTLLLLGLAVDYSVLQLRRTKEERTNGRSKEESVSTSIKWAGQAVLTAGITVIVAYVVMAVANVPVFSDVGTAIALGVSVLLLASVTLLPSLEMTLGDSLFWPSLKTKRQRQPKPSMLERISSKTIKHKVIIAVIVSLFAAGAVYGTASTPTGLDLLKLIPNFPSNQGLTVISNSLGSSTISPTTIVVVTPTAIVYGDNQFNQTLLNEIELISSTASNTPGVVSVTSPTRPYGSPFNYSSIQNMTDPLYSQYLSEMTSQIGKDNKTVLITVGFSSPSESAASVNTLLKMKSSVKSLSLEPNTQIYYAGDAQGTYDTQSFINQLLPEVVIILAAAVYVILFIQLRSAFTPLRLVFTILCSVSFALSLLSIIYYHLLNIPILNFAPLFVVVTMLGVGIDYDIFFVTRIREEVLNGKTDTDAIRTATSKVWVTIFGLGLVLSSVFGSLLMTTIPMLQEISLAVSSAVLIDISVVILFFVPSLMAIAQRFNWWPSKMGRKPEELTTKEKDASASSPSVA